MLDLRKLAPYDAALIQHGLISTGYLILDGTPKGVPGEKTDASYAEWVRDNAPGAPSPSGTAEELANRITRIASQFVGLREVVSNTSWDKPSTPGPDKELSDRLVALMRPSPWREGWAYCAAFCEGVVAEALREMGFTEHQLQRWHDVMTPHVVTSARNFESKRSGGQRMLKATPAPGALWLARKGTTADGHAGIVVSHSGSTLSNIEANTSTGPDVPAKEREGDWITPRLRNLTKNGSLLTMGFVHPADVLRLVA